METITLKLSGLHCTSCAVNIDLTLEDIPGVKKSDTNYAKSESKITFDSSQTNAQAIKKIITNLGYQVS
jgi:copper chaperone CopZ